MAAAKQRYLAFEMLGANGLANLAGVLFNPLFGHSIRTAEVRLVWQNPAADLVDALFTPLAFVFVAVVTWRYEAPIRQALKGLAAGGAPPPALARARVRLLNEPFFLIALDFSMWGAAAVLYPLLFWHYGQTAQVIRQSVISSLSAGLITVTVAFFLLEHVLQKRLAPAFFPTGGMSRVAGARRIRIRTRLAALLVACNIIPLLNILFLVSDIGGGPQEAAEMLSDLRGEVLVQSMVFMVAGLCLAMLVGRNLSVPFGEIHRALAAIRGGRFDHRIRITSNDEIGHTADAINEMAAGLAEREKMRASLMLAREVQQHLLPKAPPRVVGLDIAGTSIYCEETGGDYYDYLRCERQAVLLAVGDVSDHGLSSAMLMTTARALLRLRAARPGTPAEVAADVNRQLARDVEDTGRFMTLLLLEANRKAGSLHWVNAGHDAAMVLEGGRWELLARTGLPLGIGEEQAYRQRRRPLAAGQLVAVGTDGIWEAQDRRGRMFGKARFRALVETNAGRPASEIVGAVVAAVEEFRGAAAADDDLTLVVVKVL